MVEVFTLKVNLSATQLARPATGMINRAWPADEVLEFSGQLLVKTGVILQLGIGCLKVFQCKNQCF